MFGVAVAAGARGRGRGGRRSCAVGVAVAAWWPRLGWVAVVAVAAPHAPAAQTAGRRAPVRSRRGPGSCGAAAAAPRGCPPSARDRRAPPRQPNVNLGATRARTRPATPRAPQQPAWRHERRWRGGRRPSWCLRFAFSAQSNMQIARTSRGSAICPRVPGPRVVERLPGRGEGSLRRDRWASLRLPSCTSALARTAADSFPEASREVPPGDAPPGELGNTTQVLPHN